VLWAVILDMLHVAWKVSRGRPVRGSTESAYRRSTFPEAGRA
jgi:hypothetical protein